MTQHILDQMSLPPPPMLDLFDGDRTVGWIRAGSIGFDGFASEQEAATAAWLANETLARRLARDTGRPRVIEVPALHPRDARDGDALIARDGRQFGRMTRPDSRGGNSFGFEVDVPEPAGELRLRSMAYLIYRTLRRSGVRWAAPLPAVATPGAPSSLSALTPIELVAGTVLAAIAIVVAIMLVITMPAAVGIPIAMALLAGPLWKGTTYLARRWRRRPRRRDRQGFAPAGADHAGVVAATPVAAPAGIPGLGALAGLSMALLVVALAIPPDARVVIGGIGLAGLLIFRLFAMNAGWAPRGSAWSRQTRGALPALSRVPSATERRRISNAGSRAGTSGIGTIAGRRTTARSG